MNFLIILALVVGVTLAPKNTAVADVIPITPLPEITVTVGEIIKAETPESLIVEVFGKSEPFVSIARCESGFRQFDENGKVVHGIPHPPDTGLFQINMSKGNWLGEDVKRGLDVNTLEGNIKMAKVIYDLQGLSAWKQSRDCWDK